MAKCGYGMFVLQRNHSTNHWLNHMAWQDLQCMPAHLYLLREFLSFFKNTLTNRTSAPSHDLRQRLVIQGFSDPTNPITLSKLSIPLSPHVGGPQRPVGFMPSAASLAFHPVRCPFLSMLAEAYVRLRWLSLLADLIPVVQSRCSSVLRLRLC